MPNNSNNLSPTITRSSRTIDGWKQWGDQAVGAVNEILANQNKLNALNQIAKELTQNRQSSGIVDRIICIIAPLDYYMEEFWPIQNFISVLPRWADRITELLNHVIQYITDKVNSEIYNIYFNTATPQQNNQPATLVQNQQTPYVPSRYTHLQEHKNFNYLWITASLIIGTGLIIIYLVRKNKLRV